MVVQRDRSPALDFIEQPGRDQFGLPVMGEPSAAFVEVDDQRFTLKQPREFQRHGRRGNFDLWPAPACAEGEDAVFVRDQQQPAGTIGDVGE